MPTLDYTNEVALGEFLLGYPNEYGKYTDRPLLPAATHAALSPAEDNAAQLDFGRNGTYIVFRQLEQDVAAFWQFAQRAAEGDAAQREKISAAMVGRQRSGEPVVPLATERIGGIDPKTAAQNNFTYSDGRTPISRCHPVRIFDAQIHAMRTCRPAIHHGCGGCCVRLDFRVRPCGRT